MKGSVPRINNGFPNLFMWQYCIDVYDTHRDEDGQQFNHSTRYTIATEFFVLASTASNTAEQQVNKSCSMK